MLGGTAWIEAGGDPEFVDKVAYNIRSFDWSGPAWVDHNLTVTNHPNKTSFGAVSMQLRTAADTLGVNFASLSSEERASLINCLETDVYNLKIVARHLKQLALFDYPNEDTRCLTDERIKIIGARYNRGTGLSLEAIKKNMSYGEFILGIRSRVKALLNNEG